MKVIIVRHAQTDDNIGDKLAARTSDVLLNKEGIRQAEKLGAYLKHEKISHVYVSPQRRAVHTAEYILAHHGNVRVHHIEDLKEQNMGELDGLPKAVIKELRKKATDPWHLFKAKEGESYVELQARAKNFFHGLVKKHPNNTVLVVSHGGTLGVLLLDILEKELTEENYRDNQPKNTEFTILEISPEGYKKIHVLNSREHLDE